MQRVFLPILLLLSLMTTCIEVDISVPGFPDIARFFNVNEAMVQHTITYNFLGFCISALFYGPLSERYGRRKIMLAGNLIMVLGAIGCVYANTIEFLITSRFIQGIGASTAIVLVFAMIADLYETPKAMRLIGLSNAFLSASMTVAPLIGGFINEAVGWRGNYTIVAMLSIFIILLQYFFLPESKKNFSTISKEKVIEDYKKLFSSSEFMSAALIPSLLFAAYMAYIADSAFLYVNAYGLSTMQFVMHQATIIGSFAICSIFSANVIKNFGPQKSTTLSMGFCCAAAIFLLSLGYLGIQSALTTTSAMVLFSMGFAVCYPIIFSNSLSIFPHMYGTASSAIMSLRALLISAFTSFAGYMYNGQLIRVALPIALGIFVSSLLLMKTKIYKTT